jgi:hypothetical protein
MKKTKKKEILIRNLDDFRKLYFPNSRKEKRYEEMDPGEFGRKLARDSFEKFKHLLTNPSSAR